MPFGRNHYIRSLESRVEQLESCLVERGLPDPGNSQWQYQPQSTHSRQNSITHMPVGQLEVNPPTPGQVEPPEFDLVSEDDDEGQDFQVESMVGVLKDLSLDANGGYIGPSSHITMGRLVGFLLKEKKQPGRNSSPRYRTSISISGPPSLTEDEETVRFSEIAPEVGDRMIVGYMKHISTRWPVLHSVWVKGLHARRHTIFDTYEECILHLVYATGGRFLETAGEVNPAFKPESHYAAALKHLDEILQFRDTRSVCTLMLLAVYCLRASGDPGAWAYSRLAMLNAIDLGLHRQIPPAKGLHFGIEMRKRIFWACYAFDRQISIPLGRPFGLSDRDIDVPLPLDIDEACNDPDVLENAFDSQAQIATESTSAPPVSTTMSLWIHVLRIRRIESQIQQTIYRVDQTEPAHDSVIDDFITQLTHWKNMIPQDTRRMTDSDGKAFDGYDHYMVFYFKTLRLLLYPQLTKPQISPRFLKALAASCGSICQTYKRLHQIMYVGYSMMSLQTVFLAGLTLICCAWSSPSDIYTPATSNDINACSIVLFVMAERMHAAKKYRNAFEVVRAKIADQIAEGGMMAPRQAVGELTADLRETIMKGAEDEGLGSTEQFEEMVRLMAGQQGEGSWGRDGLEVGGMSADFTQYGGFEGHVVGFGSEYGFEMREGDFGRETFEESDSPLGSATTAGSDQLHPHLGRLRWSRTNSYSPRS
ncbi:hypothetical protein BU16DRAFT_619297 [Lophium mytilinum]|uniref:Xylanolytic transcriptional activator regulatory domain-containing protein n=1 Tax=Lophium mytilinum TaxID=390894 RepID=A0A6A6QPQ6_9PEZI|nr:hypothetical protein BU16DRAFT_619297 [Lophium mytilinum]